MLDPMIVFRAAWQRMIDNPPLPPPIQVPK